MRERRDDLRDVMLSYDRTKAAHYPHLVYDSLDERAERLGFWHSGAATDKKCLQGLEEAVRDSASSVRDWSPEARSSFFSAVSHLTGRSFFDIAPDASKAVARLVHRKKQTFTAYELLLLRDYVSDYPDGDLVELASRILRKAEASV